MGSEMCIRDSSCIVHLSRSAYRKVSESSFVVDGRLDVDTKDRLSISKVVLHMFNMGLDSW